MKSRGNPVHLLLAVGVVVVSIAMLSSCRWFSPKIVGTLGDGFTSSRSISETSRSLGGGGVEELWLVRLERGTDSVVFPGSVRNAEVFAPDRSGDFRIVIRDPSTEYAIIAARPSELDPKDEIVAVLSFSVDPESGTLIFPAEGLSGRYDMGSVTFTDGEGESELSVDDNAGAMSSSSIQLMRNLVDADNSVKLLINDHVNYHGEGDFSLPELMIRYAGPTIPAIQSGTATSADYSYSAISVLLFSEDSTTQMQFVSPSGTPVPASGNNGAGTVTKWGMEITGSTIEDGWWQLIDADTGTKIAEFDLSLGFPVDGSGEPLSLVPLPTFITDGSGDVTGVTLEWVASDGSDYFQISDVAALDTLIGKMEFWFQLNSESTQTYVTYMFDEIRQDQPAPRMYGDMLGFTFDQPFDPAMPETITIGYRFGFYRVLVTFPAT